MSKATFGPYSPTRRAGGLVYTSGQVGVDPVTKSARSGVKAQTEQALVNLSMVLDAEGLALRDVVKTTVFLQNIVDFAEVNEAYGSFFQDPYPARSCVEVACLPRVAGDTELLVEIEAVAYSHRLGEDQ